MAFRTAGTLHLQSTTVAQPLLGSWITAGIGAPSDVPLTVTLGNMGGDLNDAELIFGSGDPVWLIDPNGSNGEQCRISSITAPNQVTLAPLQDYPAHVTRNTHVSGGFGTGTFILLHYQVNNLYVQREDGGGGTWLYIGNSYNFSANYRMVAKLANVSSGNQPVDWSASEASPGNPFMTSEMWVLGGAGNSLDGYHASLNIA